MPVVIHAQFQEVPQKTAGLRNSEGERVLYFGFWGAWTNATIGRVSCV